MDGAIPLLRQVDMVPEERLPNCYRDSIHFAAPLARAIHPKTPFDPNTPMPAQPRQMCHQVRVGKSTIGGKDDRTTAGQQLSGLIQKRFVYVIRHTATGGFRNV